MIESLALWHIIVIGLVVFIVVPLATGHALGYLTREDKLDELEARRLRRMGRR